ncbi:MAG: lamin tail domain-containing protein [Limisphaerales bacterium]
MLRAGMNDAVNPFLTDEFVRSLVRDTGVPSPAGTFVHLFLNGVHKGYYNPCERIDIDFLRAYHGGGEKWDLMAQSGEVREGDANAYNTLRTLASTRDLTQPANLRDVASRLDLTNFVDYLLPLIYVDNDDWPHNNWRAARERVDGGLFRMYCWDAEWAFGLVNGHSPTWDSIRNQLSSTSPPWGTADIQRIFNGLKRAPEFRQLFADRAHRHLFNGGVLTDDRLRVRYAQITNRLAGVVGGFNNRIATTWIPQRRRNVLLHLERAGFLASSNAPGFSRFGGRVPDGYPLVLTNLTGSIFYTTNGADPRLAFTGEISPEARQYSVPIPLLQSTLIRARTLDGTNWSAVTEASFEVNRLGTPLVFSEIMYNPPGGESYEFVELHNHGTLPLDVSGFSLTGVSFRFPTPHPLMPGGARWVLANSARPVEFAARYPAVTVAGWFEGSLNNGGERLELLAPDGTLVTAVEYDDSPPWPAEADGSGRSLELDQPHDDPHDPAAWHASLVDGGSPGTAGPPRSVPIVRLSEVTAAPAPAPDWIELRNFGAQQVILDGWSLSDDGDPGRFVFPMGTSLDAGAWLRVWCGTNATESLPGLRTTFSLSRQGETIALYDARRARVDAVTFGHLPEGYSLGRVGVSLDWRLTEPTPLAPNEPAPLASPTLLTINEWLANPIPGDDDWVEFHNPSPSDPIALRGLHVGTSNRLTQIRSASFIGPSSHVVFRADENPGANHLALKLPANAGAIVLSDESGVEFSRVTYRLPMTGLPVGAEGVSLGRFPDGTGDIVAFPDTPSPGAPNDFAPPKGPRFNEFMASNSKAVAHPSGGFPDWVELVNPGAESYDLTGASLAIGDSEAPAWVFPRDVSIPAGGHVLIWCDPTIPASTDNSAPLNLGRGLPTEGTTLRLVDPRGRLLDSITFGFQIPDRSAGRTASGAWTLLASPTPGAPNSPPAALGNPRSTRFNEWQAETSTNSNSASGFNTDWVELHNTDSLPVDLGGHFLTDDPSVAGTDRFQVPPLTFVPGRGHVAWRADGRADQGPDHLPFQLDGRGETLRLYASNRSLIESLSFEIQTAGVAGGRFPDGADRIEAFPGSSSPGESNWRVHPGLAISEVLTHTDPPLEDAIEIHNLTGHPLPIPGWRVSNAVRALDKFRFPPGTVVPPGGRLVLYEKDFNPPGSPTAFTLNSAHGDDVWISEISATGEPTGYRAHVRVAAAANGISFGLHRTSVGWDFPPLSRLTFGRDLPTSVAEFRLGTGLPNAYPLVGPVVVTEILFDPAPPDDLPAREEFNEEFVEITNTATQPVSLFDPLNPSNTWRLRGGIQFDFPPGIALAPSEHLLVVGFDPTKSEGAAFRSRRGLLAETRLLGPFSGRLSNEGEEVRLERPDRPQAAPSPDAGFVPYLLVERVSYGTAPPWPQGSPASETSLQRRRTVEYANDPANWVAASPSPGGPTRPPISDRDFDGLPNDWELSFGLNPDLPSDADLDSDGDRLSNREEYLSGTDPRNPASALKLELELELEHRPDQGLGAELRFIATAHRGYSVLTRDDAAHGAWRKIADIPAEATDRIAKVPLELPANNAGFLRVVTPGEP